jgi:hypothetical protein
MISDQPGMQLHDHWTPGQTLTAEEQAQLEAWYQQQDAAEAQQLNQVFTAAGISALQAQVEMALTQLAVDQTHPESVSTYSIAHLILSKWWLMASDCDSSEQLCR